MQRMQAEARRSREREEAAARRLHRRNLRTLLANAERDAAGYCREYRKALRAYLRCSDAREPQMGRALDRAYNMAMVACNRERELRRELEQC